MQKGYQVSLYTSIAVARSVIVLIASSLSSTLPPLLRKSDCRPFARIPMNGILATSIIGQKPGESGLMIYVNMSTNPWWFETMIAGLPGPRLGTFLILGVGARLPSLSSSNCASDLCERTEAEIIEAETIEALRDRIDSSASPRVFLLVNWVYIFPR